MMFQSTPLCEGRHPYAIIQTSDKGFNPRPSVRGDIARGARAYVCNGFNPRPSVRGDIRLPNRYTNYKGFNPRPSVRGDFSYMLEYSNYVTVSIHAPL